MRVCLLAVGRLKAPFALTGCEEFASRITKTWPIDLREVADAVRRGGKDAANFKAQEGDALLAALAQGSGPVVVLDERGAGYTSRRLAEWLGQRRDGGARSVTFVIGGPDGLDERVRAKADLLLSLSALTMPHELARLVLLEQLYRATCILYGRPYHRD